MLKINSDRLGYEIHDSTGVRIFKVETRYSHPVDHPDSSLVTTLVANFYNQHKELVFAAKSGEPDERIEANCKFMFGYQNGVYGVANGLTARGSFRQVRD